MILDDLRAAIKKSGLSLYELEKRTGVNNGNLSRFMGGERLGMGSAEKIARELGLRLKRPTKG